MAGEVFSSSLCGLPQLLRNEGAKISQALTTDEHFRKAGFSALLVD